jgi:KDO2-lipid IV(A) lauroyltransferase
MSSLKFKLLQTLIHALGYIPLPAVHGIGVLFGWLSYAFTAKHARLTQSNLRLSATCPDEKSFRRTLHQNIGESGKTLLETFAIWFRSDKQQLSLVHNIDGLEFVEAARDLGKGLIFLTPHLGCFEITSLYYGAHYPMTVLYRQPRQAWLMPLISAGRQRGKVTLAPANSQGVKLLLQALKRGEAVGILPDQAPFEGEGAWAPFFKRPAYTMTLASKLAEKTGAQVFMAFGERLSFGRGYHIHIRPIAAGGIDTPALLNAEIETTIRQCPAQYLWGYDRYKDRQQNSPANH